MISVFGETTNVCQSKRQRDEAGKVGLSLSLRRRLRNGVTLKAFIGVNTAFYDFMALA